MLHVEPSGNCVSGYHDFVISRWSLSEKVQKANAFTCRYCLATVEGSDKIQEVRDNVSAHPKFAAVSKTSS